MKVKISAVFVSILFLLFHPARAENKEPLGIWLDSSSMSPLKLPASGGIPDILDRFEYPADAVPYAFQKDLNGDGKKEFLIAASAGQCGTGGCPYAMVDGRSLRRIGDFFGSPILVAGQKINGYPVIQTYSHASAGSGTFTTYVHDGKEYRTVSAVFLAGESVDELFKNFAGYKKILAPKNGKDK